MTVGGFPSEVLERWRWPVGFGVAAFVVLVVGVAADVKWLVVLTPILLLAAGVTGARESVRQPRPVVELSTVPISDEDRQRVLQQALSQDLMVSRGQVLSQSAFSAVVVTGRRVNHLLHLLVSVLLCGFWLPVWLIISLSGGERRVVLSVDQCGNVTRR